MDGIFISYRRDDSAGYAGRLYDRLAAHFGTDRVFMDVEGIEPGTDFVVAIEKALASCRVLIVLMGDEWLDITDGRGRRRLDDPNDFIRLETGTALQRDVRVVPVLLDGTPMPDADALPEDLKSLVRRHAVELTHKQWEATSGELIATLEKILSQETSPTPGSTPGPSAAPPAPPAAGHKKPWWLLGLIMVLAALGVGYWSLSGIKSASVESASSRVAVELDTTRDPKLGSDVTQLDFGEVEAGKARIQEWRIRNDGNAASTVELVLDGPDANAFSMPVETCSAGIRDNSLCSVSIQYKPTAEGTQTARLSAKTSDTTTAVTLVGIGRPTAPSAENPVPPTDATAAAAPAVAPASAPASAAPSRPVESRPTPPPQPPKPRFEDLKSIAQSGGVKLCYRITGATRVAVMPSDIVAENASRGCVDVPLEKKTTLTVIASNAGARSVQQIEASPQAAPNANRLLPSPGDRWTYRLRGKWANSPKRTVSVTVDKVDGALIYETMALQAPSTRPGGQKRSSATRPAIIDWTWLGWEFSPWFVTDTAIRDGRWSGFSVPDVGSFWTNWRGEAKVVGRETVTVPAGTFETIKVQVLAQRRQSGSPTEAEVEPVQTKLTVWYSPKAKRYVKMERIVDAASRNEIERDQIELVSYTTQ